MNVFAWSFPYIYDKIAKMMQILLTFDDSLLESLDENAESFKAKI